MIGNVVTFFVGLISLVISSQTTSLSFNHAAVIVNYCWVAVGGLGSIFLQLQIVFTDNDVLYSLREDDEHWTKVKVFLDDVKPAELRRIYNEVQPYTAELGVERVVEIQ